MLEDVLSNLLSFEVLIACVFGIVFGLLIGALPGLTATMGLSLLIPVTYSLSQAAALSMLACMYTSAVFGGSYTAILLHTPGTPSSAATALDGYQMTLQGKGLQAMGIATVGSVFGGVVSAIFLILLCKPLADISLTFGAPEYFWVYIFGLTVIGSLASGNVFKGLLSGVLGLIISMVGMSYYTGDLRFTFGVGKLFDGFATVPAMIGLFSFSQVLIQVEDWKKGTKRRFEKNSLLLKGRMIPDLPYLLKLLPTMIRSAIIGVGVGILPGAGGDIGSWMGYNEAKRWAKAEEKESFGKGNPKGVCASEAANNATTGGAMIPLLALGIPGSAPAAVLLGALLLHGLQPGPLLFTKSGPVIYAMMIAFLIGNVLMGLFGVAIGRPLVRICNVPNCVLTPIIVALAVVGSFAINHSIFDVYTMLGFGVLGYAMRKCDIPPAPMVLGMLLGAGMEEAYLNSVLMAKGESVVALFFSRPICLVIIILVAASIFSPLLIKLAKKVLKKDNFSLPADTE